ncbi:MAG: Divalent-cation tolerance protein CutA [Synergistetes bacterium ADurb.Bin520]|mgnify:FL=1|nr:MAG: Divalent-cation tolerance protein CutA [Synergistetes bacterium ADurb.Bin520]
MNDEHLLAFVSAPPEVGRTLAQALVDEKTAACVQIIPGAASFYRWKGRIESDQESLLLIKTLRSCLPRIRALVEKIHPYEIPELLCLPIVGGLDRYLDWLRDNVDPREAPPD